MKNIVLIVLPTILLAGCGNPGDVSDDFYLKYKELGAPKLLYSCTTTMQWNLTGEGRAALGVCLDMKGIASDEQIDCLLEVDKKNVPVDDIQVGYAAGIGIASTYNKLLSDAKAKCTGEFKILESQQ